MKAVSGLLIGAFILIGLGFIFDLAQFNAIEKCPTWSDLRTSLPDSLEVWEDEGGWVVDTIPFIFFDKTKRIDSVIVKSSDGKCRKTIFKAIKYIDPNRVTFTRYEGSVYYEKGDTVSIPMLLLGQRKPAHRT